ncbi:MAG: carbohydrate kinase [Eubacteriales bacterium]|nr:carbohydrate kinase [Eubacteriales bacterium]
MALAGVDIGTSGCKCTVMRLDGTEAAVCYREYEANRSLGAHEIDAGVILENVRAVIDGCLTRTTEPVTAVCVTSFGESCALLDEHDRVIRPVMLYTDPRGQEEADELGRVFGERSLFDETGHKPSPMYLLPKLLYLRRHEPENFARIRMILPVNAYVAYMLTREKEPAVDYSLASRTMLLDVKAHDWSRRLLDYAGLRRDQLPSSVNAGTAVGTLIGRPEIKVVIGCHDQVAAVIGADGMRAGTAVCGSGTVECVTPVFDRVPTAQAFFDGEYCAVPAVNDLYVTYAFILSGGALLQWFRNELARDVRAAAAAEGRSAYEMLNAGIRPGPTGLFVLPHFAGSATPYGDSAAKGAIVGLTLGTDRIDIYKAIMEGISYEVKVNFECLAASGIRIGSMCATGGGSRSADWLQLKSDILGIPISTLNVSEAGTVGSVVLAGIATGELASTADAGRIVRPVRTFEPGPDAPRYAELYEKYKRIYPAVKEIER